MCGLMGSPARAVCFWGIARSKITGNTQSCVTACCQRIYLGLQRHENRIADDPCINMYFQEMGDLDLDAFRVQYQATSNSGDVFRQIITANNPITEKVTVNNISIPLLAEV